LPKCFSRCEEVSCARNSNIYVCVCVQKQTDGRRILFFELYGDGPRLLGVLSTTSVQRRGILRTYWIRQVQAQLVALVKPEALLVECPMFVCWTLLRERASGTHTSYTTLHAQAEVQNTHSYAHTHTRRRLNVERDTSRCIVKRANKPNSSQTSETQRDRDAAAVLGIAAGVEGW